MKEKFAIPAVGAIIVKRDAGEEFILVQNRRKNNGDGTDGLLEIPAGKVREYENIFEALRREVREETGLHLTKVRGEEDRQFLNIDGNKTIAFAPYCVTQNLSGTCCIRLTQTYLYGGARCAGMGVNNAVLCFKAKFRFGLSGSGLHSKKEEDI